MTHRTAIITGAGRGIGRATAAALSRRGYACVLMARSAHELDAAAHDCAVARVAPGDVSSETDIARAVQVALDEFGRVDALVNNAGLAPMAPIEETSLADWRRTIDVNLTSAFLACRAVWPHFVRQGAGVIVNVSSMAAKDPLPGFLGYAAAKAGLNALGLALARQGASKGIRVHTVAPGAVETRMFRSLVDESTWPTDRTLLPSDVADVIAACVEGTLRYASGEVIYLRREPG